MIPAYKSLSVFPARAGVILLVQIRQHFQAGLSRTSGGDPLSWDMDGMKVGSFPHERG